MPDAAGEIKSFLPIGEFNFDPSKTQYIGFRFQGKGTREHFFTVKCPCGIEDSRAPEDFPKVNTPHKCGNPNHWFARFYD